MTVTPSSPVCQFYQLIPSAPKPRRADRSAEGTLPVNAYRYCEPIARASAFGWYIYPPLNFALILDGTEILWTYENAPGWYPLVSAAQFPNFVKTYSQIAPGGAGRTPHLPRARSLAGNGPLVAFSPEPTRLGATISPYGDVLQQAYENYEGIVETDTWFGPLFTNVRLTRTNAPIQFHTRYPLFQVQEPIPRPAYTDPNFEVLASTDMSLEDWTLFERTSRPSTVPHEIRPYAVETRKQLRGEAANLWPE